MIRHEKSMQLSSGYLVQRRFSSAAAAMVVISLVIGSAGVLSVLASSPQDMAQRSWSELPPDAAVAGRLR
jgi:hypothetical protein